MTDACENITFLQLLLRAINMSKYVHFRSSNNAAQWKDVALKFTDQFQFAFLLPTFFETSAQEKLLCIHEVTQQRTKILKQVCHTNMFIRSNPANQLSSNAKNTTFCCHISTEDLLIFN